MDMDSFAKQVNFKKCVEIFLVYLKETHHERFDKHHDAISSMLTSIFRHMIGSQAMAGKSLQDLNIIALTNLKNVFGRNQSIVSMSRQEGRLVALTHASKSKQRFILEFCDSGSNITKIQILKVIIPMEFVDSRSMTPRQTENVTHVLVKVMDDAIPLVFESSYKSTNHRIHAVFKGLCDECQIVECPEETKSFTIQILRPNKGLYLNRNTSHRIKSIERNALNSLISIVIVKSSDILHEFVCGDTINVVGYSLMHDPSVLFKHVSETDVKLLNRYINRALGHEIVQMDSDDGVWTLCIRYEETSTVIESTSFLDVLQSHRGQTLSHAFASNASLQPCCILRRWVA